MLDRLLKELEKLLPGKVLTKEDALLAYSFDASSLRGRPWAVLLPDTKEEVLEVLKLANRYKCPIITRGSGTSTTGSSVPLGGGIVLSLTRLNRILDFNEEERVVHCEPGVITGDLKRFVERYNLFYPPDPSSYAFSTIGGNIATGAGGPRGLKYGTTKDYVLALEVGLPGGRLIRTGPKTLKKSSHYNLTPLFIGSEGTLGVVLSAWLRLIPLPEKRALFLVRSKDEAKLLGFINQILRMGITPSSAEFIDQTSLLALKLSNHPLVRTEDKAFLLLEVDGKACCVEKEAQAIEKALGEFGVSFEFSSDASEMERLWEVRRSLSPSLRILGSKKLSDDLTIPRRYNVEFLSYLRSHEEGSGIRITAFGHVGDGNFHVNIYFEEGDEEKARNIRESLIKKVLELSGTVSGEHGIGFTKKAYFALELSEEELNLMRSLKALFDPYGILNPGVKIP
jgi:glycolate oxidase